MDYMWGLRDRQASVEVAEDLGTRLEDFVLPLLIELDREVDKRLVRTFLATLQAIVRFRNRAQGLLLSELGAYILSPDHAPAGTKRLSNLLRSRKWTARIVETFLWCKADQALERLETSGEDAFVVWDESVLEKSESIAIEGLCAVRSSKARRLTRIKPGYFNPPGGRPVMVPGMHWVTLLLLGLRGVPQVAAMEWWTTRGEFASDRRSKEINLLERCAETWGRRVIHVWDRGFSGGPWLAMASHCDVRFILRWQKGYKLVDEEGCNRKAWEITRGKRSWEHRPVWDARRRCYHQTGIVAVPVSHPDYNGNLWLVVSRPGKGRSPWYLVTNEPISSPADAWRIVFAYARRWQVEVGYRYAKSELAMESPRLWRWEDRIKLLLMVTLVYAFLLSLLESGLESVREWLFDNWCHRTGKRNREASIPLYRLRLALCFLWTAHPPPQLSWGNSG
jgi:hypothetical protein